MARQSVSAIWGESRGGKASVAGLLIVGLLLLVPLLTSAQTLQLAASGTWSNATPTNSCTQIIGADIRWGESSYYGCLDWSKRSGFNFTGYSAITMVEDELFVIGTFTHRNRVIYGGSITSVNLVVTIVFSGTGAPTPKQFTYHIDFDETTNNGDCPYGGDGDDCYDRVLFTNTVPSESFVYDGCTYTIELGFRDGDELTDTLITEEKADTTVELVAYVRCTDPRSDLSVVKTDAYDPIDAGQIQVYAITVNNDGPRVCTGVVVEDTLPDGATYHSHSASKGSYNSSTGVWTVGTMDIDDTETLTLNALIALDAARYVDNTACVSGDLDDPDPSNNCDTATTQVEHHPALVLDKSGSPDTVSVGEIVTYTVIVKHAVSSDRSPVAIDEISDSLGIPLVYVSGDDGDGFLTGNEEWTYRATRVAQPTDPLNLTNEACVEGHDLDDDEVSACDTANTIIDHYPALQVDKSADPAAGAVGDIVLYTIIVQHSGSSDGSPINITDVTDSLGIDLSAPSGDDGDGVLQGAEVWTYTGSREIKKDDPRYLTNTVCVYGLDLDTDEVYDCDSVTVPVTHNPLLELVKSGPATAGVGDVVSYYFEVSHAAGSDGSPVSGLTVTDTVAGDATLISQVGGNADSLLEEGETWTYKATYTVQPTDPVSLTNQGCVDGDDLDGDSVGDCDTHTTTVQYDPSIDLVKTPDYDTLNVGNTITYDYTVTNTGDVELTSVTLEDDVLGTIDLGTDTLAPGDHTTGQATHTVTQADVDAGQIVNVADVVGTAPNSAQVTDQDTATVTIDQTATISLIKNGIFVDDGDGVAEVGEQILYAFTVQNTGNVTLKDVTVTDPLVVMTGGPATLAPGAVDSSTFRGSYAITQDDIDAGVVNNTATATGYDPGDSPVVATDGHSQPLPCAAAITLQKTAVGGPFAVGETITYTFKITNTGNVTVDSLVISDPLVGLSAITGYATTLAPGEHTTGSATYVVKQADVDAGVLDNTATAEGDDPNDDPVTAEDSESVPFAADPSIDLVKTPDYDTPLNVDDVITYDYTVTNDGNVTLTNIVLEDNVLGTIDLGAATLAPGESTTGQATHTVTQADVDAGQIVNVADVTGTAPDSTQVTDQDTATVMIPQEPALAIEKTGDGGPISVGETVNYTITVSNTGNLTLHNVTLTDPMLGLTQDLGTLPPGDVRTTNATYGPVSLGDLPGPLVNTATADSDETPGVQDDHSVEVIGGAAIALEKIVDKPTIVPGETVTYTYRVSNAGTAPLYGIALVDDKLGTISGPASGDDGDLILQVGETWRYTASTILTVDTLNTAVATGKDESGSPVEDTDTAWVKIALVDLSVTKTVNNPTPEINEVISFIITVENAPGYSEASQVWVQDILPDEIEFARAIPSQGSYDEISGIWIVGILDEGDRETLQILATVREAAEFTNLAQVVNADQPDVDSEPGNAPTVSEDDDASVTLEARSGGAGGQVTDCTQRIIINEVAWAGTAADPTNEWIELRNIGTEPVDLAGWVLRWRLKDETSDEEAEWVIVELEGILEGATVSACERAGFDAASTAEFIPRDDSLSWSVLASPLDDDGSYLILERISDNTISNRTADIVYDTEEPYAMELHDEGDIIQLINAVGEVVDTANAHTSPDSAWVDGDASTHATMERTNPLELDSPDNWHTNAGIVTDGLDASGRPLVATADTLNSQSLEQLTATVSVSSSEIVRGDILEVTLELSRAERTTTGWPWLYVTQIDTAGGGGAVPEPSIALFSFSGVSTDTEYFLTINSGFFQPGEHRIWVVYGGGRAILVPITVLP